MCVWLLGPVQHVKLHELTGIQIKNYFTIVTSFVEQKTQICVKNSLFLKDRITSGCKQSQW